MHWFLRLFGAFRDLEALLAMQSACAQESDREITDCRAALESVTSDKLMLQDRLEAALADKDHLWNAMQEALNNERSALRMQVNHAVQRAGGGIPYPDEHSLPSTAARAPQLPGPIGRRGRQLPSEMVLEQTQAFVKEFVAGVTRG